MVNMFAPVYVSNLYIRSNVQRNIVYTWFVGYMFMWYHSKSMSIFQKRALFQCILKCPISYMRAYIYIYMYVYIRICIYVYICMYVYMYGVYIMYIDTIEGMCKRAMSMQVRSEV
jgi:hypothetical protein